MLNCPDLDPAIANAAYIEFRASVAWLFDDTSEETVAHGRLALAALEDLRPASALEARLAAQVIATDVHAMDCLRLAAEHRDDLKTSARCRAQANAMMRQMHRAHRMLEALQKERRDRDTARAEMARLAPPAAAFAEPRVAPPAAGFVEPRVAPPAAAVAEPRVAPLASATVEPSDETMPPTALAKAEQFALRNQLLATRIRAAGGLTPKAVAGFRPSKLPDRTVVDALVHGSSPVLAMLDRAGRTNGAAS